MEHSNAVPLAGHTSEMEKILARLSPKPQHLGLRSSTSKDILAKLSEQQALLEKQKDLLASNSVVPASRTEADQSSAASPPASAVDPPLGSVPIEATRHDAGGTETSELYRLKQELLAANSKIALQEQELAQTRVIKHTLDQALGPPSEVECGGREISEQTISHLQNAFNASSRAPNQYQDAWNGQDDSQSDISDALSTGAYNRARGFWVPPAQHMLGMGMNASAAEKVYGDTMPLTSNSAAAQDSSKLWNSAVTNAFPSHGPFQPHRVLSGPSLGPSGFDARFSGEQARYLQGPGLGPRRAVTQMNRGGSYFTPQNSSWGTFPTGPPGNSIPRSPASRPCSTYQQIGLYPVPPYHPRPVGAPLSPTATEFTSSSSNLMSWANTSVSSAMAWSAIRIHHIYRSVETPSKHMCHHLSL